MCEKCKYKVAIQKRRLKKLPRILVIHLKRFRPSPSDPTFVDKIFDPVKIDKSLIIGNDLKKEKQSVLFFIGLIFVGF